MSTVDEIKEAITNLSPEDFAHVRNWLLEIDHQLWDKQMEDDVKSGRMDSILMEVEGDIAACRIKALREIIDRDRQ